MDWSIKLSMIAGVYHAGLCIFHLGFYSLFGWKTHLKRLDNINRAILPVINWSLALFFMGMAGLFFLFGQQLMTGPMGLYILGFLTLFWIVRLIFQPLYFGYNRVSNIFIAIFALGALLPASMLGIALFG